MSSSLIFGLNFSTIISRLFSSAKLITSFMDSFISIVIGASGFAGSCSLLACGCSLLEEASSQKPSYPAIAKLKNIKHKTKVFVKNPGTEVNFFRSEKEKKDLLFIIFIPPKFKEPFKLHIRDNWQKTRK